MMISSHHKTQNKSEKTFIFISISGSVFDCSSLLKDAWVDSPTTDLMRKHKLRETGLVCGCTHIMEWAPWNDVGPTTSRKDSRRYSPRCNNRLGSEGCQCGSSVWEVCRLSLLYTILPEVSVSLFYVVLIQPLLEYIFNFLHRIL